MADYGGFLTTGESVYSSLMPWQAESAAAAFRLWTADLRSPCIVDANAHVGLDSANLLLNLDCSVVAIEQNPDTFALLQKNLARWVEERRCRVLQGDCVDILLNSDLRPDLVYFDPPWGGRGYKDEGLHRLMLNGTPVEALAAELIRSGRTPMVVVKAPRYELFDAESFKDGLVGFDLRREVVSARPRRGQPRPAYDLWCIRRAT